jgi:hypothetical protein
MGIDVTIKVKATGAESEKRLLHLIGQLGELDGVSGGAAKLAERKRRTIAAAPPSDLAAVVAAFVPESDAEAAALFAFVAKREGLRGLDAATAEAWTRAARRKQPADWSYTFSNSVKSGHLVSVGGGYKGLGPKGQQLVDERLRGRARRRQTRNAR